MLFINFKTYTQATGDNAVRLALACELASAETKIPIIPVVSATDIYRVSQHTDSPVWAQHVDPVEPNQHTGFITIEALIEAGAQGTILNHSEHSLDFDILNQTIKRARAVDPDFPIMICVPTIEALKHAAVLQPDFLAYEPPELIASETESVATKQPAIISDAVSAAGHIPLIVGAGIKDVKDISVSTQKGARGVLIASAVVKSDDPKTLLIELTRGFEDS